MSNPYSNGKIYALVSEHTTQKYIGSTILSLSIRFSQHLSSYKFYSGKKNVCSSSKLFDLGDVEIELLENYPCEDKKELLLRELYWIDNLYCINVRNPIVLDRNEYMRNYYKGRRVNCVHCGIEYSKCYITHHIKTVHK